MSERVSEYFKFQGPFSGSVGSLLILVFLAVTSIAVIGCSSGQVSVSLSYRPKGELADTQPTAQIPVNVRVVDSRSNKDAVAVHYSAHGIVKADMVPEKDVALTLAEALEWELKNQGFNSVGEGLALEVRLHEFFAYNDWSGEEPAATADLLMTASVKDGSGNRLFRKMVRGKHSQPVRDYGADVASRLLETALSNAVGGLFQDTSFLKALAGESQDPSATAKAGGDARPRLARALITISGSQSPTDLLEELVEGTRAQVIQNQEDAYCYFASEYSMRSAGTFPVRLSIDHSYSRVLTISDREIEQLRPGRHVITLSDPLTGRRNRPNWDDYEFEIYLAPFTYTKIEILANPRSPGRMLTVTILENGEVTRTLYIGSK